MDQAIFQAPSTKLSLWRDINVFVAAFTVFASLGSFVVVIPVSLLAKLLLPSQQAELLAFPLAYALVALGLGYWWWKHGLSPCQRNPTRLGRFRWGHVLLAVFNLMMMIMLVPAYLGAGSLVPLMPAAARVFMGMIPLAPVALIAGLWMVLSARDTRPAFAATLPEAQLNPHQAQPTELRLESTLARRAPSAVAVALGLLVSSLLLYMAAIFAGLSFQSDVKRYTAIFLPILIIFFVFYMSTALWLLSKRNSSAVWVAWAPTVLFTVGLPVLQVLIALFGFLLGR